MEPSGANGQRPRGRDAGRTREMVLEGAMAEFTAKGFAGARIDVHALSAQLQDEGAKSFVNSWKDLLGVIESKCVVLKRASPPLRGV